MWLAGNKYREEVFGSSNKFSFHKFGIYSKKLKTLKLEKVVCNDLYQISDTANGILTKVDSMKIQDNMIDEVLTDCEKNVSSHDLNVFFLF